MSEQWKGPIVPFPPSNRDHLKFICTCGARYGTLAILETHIELYKQLPDGREHKIKETSK